MNIKTSISIWFLNNILILYQKDERIFSKSTSSMKYLENEIIKIFINHFILIASLRIWKIIL
jgi:hypothetical protein